MQDFAIGMGAEVKDRITGFKGRVTGRSQYISGCNQYAVQPVTKQDGDFIEGRWFDEHRLEVTNADPVVLEPNPTAALVHRDGQPIPNTTAHHALGFEPPQGLEEFARLLVGSTTEQAMRVLRTLLDVAGADALLKDSRLRNAAEDLLTELKLAEPYCPVDRQDAIRRVIAKTEGR